MCHLARCRKCGKTTWKGCGRHVNQIMARVPKADRCAGHENDPPAPGLFSRLFGRA